MNKKIFFPLVFALLCFFFCSLKLDLPDWTNNTHGDIDNPDYSTVFPQNSVNRIDIKISPENWQIMVNNMTEIFGPFGNKNPQRNLQNKEDPVFVPCSLFFNGREWYKVGIRFKGNSSLFTTWKMGLWKFAFKLDFDQFEDQYPEIKDQRFYGFKQIALANNFHDFSFIRERVVPEIFRSAGLKAPYTSYCRIYIDFGNGSVYFGLYTAVEVVDDTMLKNQFGSDDGNCYKPDHDGASFAYGKFTEEDFEKKTNEEKGDFGDILTLFDALHSSARITNPALWRDILEAAFNVNVFLKWLAVNTIIQNWDTYGLMWHNYYLYNDPKNGQLTWIPWDNNSALNDNEALNKRRDLRKVLSLSLAEVGPQWPLIRYLMDDPVYKNIYINNVKSIVTDVFNPAVLESRYIRLHELAKPYVIGPEGENAEHSFLPDPFAFTMELNYLLDHLKMRYQDGINFVNKNK